MNRRVPLAAAATLAAACLPIAAAGMAVASSHVPGRPAQPGQGQALTARVLLNGAQLRQPGTGIELAGPDDLTSLGGVLFVAFQNGIGPKGEPGNGGATQSTVAEFTPRGKVLREWNLTGHVDGLTADPSFFPDAAGRRLVATVNEDGNSRLFVIDPWTSGAAAITPYDYSQNPLPHGGGTDAISFDNGQMLISASAPTNPNGPAVYSVILQPPATGGSGTARITSLFSDSSAAVPADRGAPSRLHLTDPDSNTVVPWDSRRFAGDFMLDSQGDEQQVYVSNPGTAGQRLSVLALSQSVNDTAFAVSGSGVLYASDSKHDTVDAVTGRFLPGGAYTAATPCDANSAPATCPAPGYPPNYLATLDLSNGEIARVRVAGAPLQPEGLLFAPGGR